MLNSPQVRLSDIDAVFFDFGGTLVTLSPSKEELFLRAAGSIGLELEFEAVRRAYQIVDFHNKYSSVQVKDRNEFYQNYNKQLAEVLGISSHFGRLNGALIAEFRKDKKWELFPDALKALGRLQQPRLRLALVANWDANLISLTEQLGIREAFSAVVPSQLAGVEKPDPAIFRLAAAELFLSTETDRILYVGNEYGADVIGARSAGLIPVLIDREGLYPNADCLRFTSLLKWVEKMV